MKTLGHFHSFSPAFPYICPTPIVPFNNTTKLILKNFFINVFCFPNPIQQVLEVTDHESNHGFSENPTTWQKTQENWQHFFRKYFFLFSFANFTQQVFKVADHEFDYGFPGKPTTGRKTQENESIISNFLKKHVFTFIVGFLGR